MNRARNENTCIIDQNIYPMPFIFNILCKCQYFFFSTHIYNLSEQSNIIEAISKIFLHLCQIFSMTAAYGYIEPLRRGHHLKCADNRTIFCIDAAQAPA